MPQQFTTQNHVYPLPTGYRFAMTSVIDDAKKKGQDAKYHTSFPSYPQLSSTQLYYLRVEGQLSWDKSFD